MFLLYFTEVAVPPEHVLGLLPEVLVRLETFGEDAYREAEELRVRIGPGAGRSLMAKTVTLSAGSSVDNVSSTAIPLYWEATGTPGLFPRMTADLIITGLGDRRTQIRFQGNYEPPLGALGRYLDRALLHRVAESSVKALVDRIADLLESGGGSAASTEQGAEEA